MSAQFEKQRAAKRARAGAIRANLGGRQGDDEDRGAARQECGDARLLGGPPAVFPVNQLVREEVGEHGGKEREPQAEGPGLEVPGGGKVEREDRPPRRRDGPPPAPVEMMAVGPDVLRRQAPSLDPAVRRVGEPDRAPEDDRLGAPMRTAAVAARRRCQRRTTAGASRERMVGHSHQGGVSSAAGCTGKALGFYWPRGQDPKPEAPCTAPQHPLDRDHPVARPGVRIQRGPEREDAEPRRAGRRGDQLQAGRHAPSVRAFARASILTGEESPANWHPGVLRPAAARVAHGGARDGRAPLRHPPFSASGTFTCATMRRVSPGRPMRASSFPPEHRGGFDFWEGFESGFLNNDPWLHGTRIPNTHVIPRIPERRRVRPGGGIPRPAALSPGSPS